MSLNLFLIVVLGMRTVKVNKFFTSFLCKEGRRIKIDDNFTEEPDVHKHL